MELVFLDVREISLFLDKHLYNTTAFNQHFEPFFFDFIKEPLKKENINIVSKPFDSINKENTWFIDSPIRTETWGGIVNSLFECFPDHIINEVINGHGYIIFNNQDEPELIHPLRFFYNIYNKDPRVPLEKIIFLSPCINAKQYHDDWFKEQGLSETKLNLWYAGHMGFQFGQHDVDYWAAPIEIEKNKTFLNLNRKIRDHRLLLVLIMAGLGMMKNSNISFWHEGSISELEFKIECLRKRFGDSNKGKILIDMAYSGVDVLKDKMPIFLDTSNPDLTVNYGDSDRKIYKESYINLTSCTHFFKEDDIGIGWNEKEWKPIFAKQMFILIGRPGILKKMKNFGILTFDKYIDESYDSIEDDIDRFWNILQEIKRFYNMPKHQLDELIYKTNDIVDYNLNYINSNKQKIFYFSDLQKFILHAQ